MEVAKVPVSTAMTAFLPALIDNVTEAIEAYCMRSFGTATYTEVYDGDHTVSLILRTFPVQTITSITIHADTDDPQVLDPTAYRLNPKTGEVRLTNHFAGSTWEAWGASGVFPQGWQNIEAVYVAGFDVIPGGVQLAAIETVKSQLDAFRRDNNVDSERWEDYQYFRNRDRKDTFIPESAKDKLAPYRDHRV